MGGVVLHIGLHKTATRFLQRAVFGSLDPERFLVNPPALMGPLKAALRGKPVSRETLQELVAQARRDAGDRTLVVSDPTISGDMYACHRDYADNLALVHALFSDARVIYFVRRQSDWLHSAYRQSLVRGAGIPIETFLNYYEGAFQRPLARRVFGARNVDALGLQFLDIYRAYAATFGPERVYLLRQEDLRHQPEAVYTRIAEALGLERLPELPDRVSGNRAFSALAINVFFPRIHWPRRRPTSEDVGAGPPRFVRRLGKPWRKLRTALIRHAFDRLIYVDRDMLARDGMRAQLDEHYEVDYRRLSAAAERVLQEGPGRAALAWADASDDDVRRGSVAS